eukprot:m.361654 g.361654  ORF g.361654 m.361654 type:complete len:339 (+) comp19753_c0_seq1:323-1339(+)
MHREYYQQEQPRVMEMQASYNSSSVVDVDSLVQSGGAVGTGVSPSPTPLPPHDIEMRNLDGVQYKIVHESNAYSTPGKVLTMVEKAAEAGKKKGNMPLVPMFISAMLSGCFLGFGSCCIFRIGGVLPSSDEGFVRLVSGLFGLPIGLTMIALCGTQLFTSNCALLSVAVYKRVLTVGRALLCQLIVFIGNLCGSLLFVFFITYSEILTDNAAGEAAIHLAEKKLSSSFGVAVLRGILCNWFVCMAIWQSMVAKPEDVTGKAVGIYPSIMGFVALGFEHSIANMFIIPQAMVLGLDATVGEFLAKNLVPAAIGNMLSGVFFVGLAFAVIDTLSDVKKRQ